MRDLITELLTKFVRKQYFYESNYNQSLKDVSELVFLDVQREVLKPLNLSIFQIHFFQVRVLKPSYPSVFNFTNFQALLFLTKKPAISCQDKHAQFLHPEKRSQVGSTSEISNLALKIAKALGNRWTKLFYVDEPLTAEEICDKVRSEWLKYQLADIPREYYIKEVSNEPCKSARASSSYWDKAYALIELNLLQLPSDVTKY